MYVHCIHVLILYIIYLLLLILLYLAQTRFLECENCRHFFVVLSGRGYDKNKNDFQKIPPPKKV